METYTDALGQKRNVSVNCETIERARAADDKIDILEAGMAAEHEDPTECVEFRLTGDPLLFCRVLWHFLDPEPEEKDYPAYAKGLAGDALAAARAALWADLVNFTPSPEEK